jgi:hypothetical protein
MFNNWGDIYHSRFMSVNSEISYRPFDLLQLSFEPSYTKGRRDLQYVETLDYGADERYIISTLNSDRLSADFRINFSITPDLSIQYWGQPFLFAGDYSTYKRNTEPMNDDYYKRFHVFAEDEIFYNSNDNLYEIDENRDGTIDYSFENPNFNFFEFRSNLVARWEYIPGSVIYVVWSQGRTDETELGDFKFRNDMNDLFSVIPHNVFLVKITYRISI